ncbi:unnamed protein product, partial [Owenia fusiformis]
FLDNQRDLYHLKTYSDIFLACRFNGEICNESDFTTISLDNYGNCYTFKSNITERYMVREIGPDSGLTLILFLNDYSPLDEFRSKNRDVMLNTPNLFSSKYSKASDGIRLGIHSHGTLPDLDNEGIDLSPG